MTCPYLEYRQADETHQFDHDRPYCVAQGEFVAPVKSDICNDRFDFDHEDCDVFQIADAEQSAGSVSDD